MTAGITLVVVALLGALLGEWLGDRFKQHMPLLLSFGGAFLLGLCFLHLLPEAFAMNVGAGHWVIGGFLLQIGLEYLSKGMEHGSRSRQSVWLARLSQFMPARFDRSHALWVGHRTDGP